MEYLKNNASTTLNGGIDDDDVTLVVNSATPFPTTGNFRIKIDTELLLVTGVSGTTWTVTRGIEGTTAASHGSSTPVIHVLTEKGMETYIGEYILEGATSGRPAAAKAGRMYLPNDSQVVFRDNGSSWDAFGPLWKLTTPDNADYSWANQQSAVATGRNDGILLAGGTAASSAWSVRARAKNRLSTATGYKLTVGMISQLGGSNFSMAGIGLLETGTGKAIFIRNHSDGGTPKVTPTTTTALQAGTTGTVGTSYDLGFFGSYPTIHWMQIEQTSTNLIFRYSNNKVDWVELYSVAIAGFFTTNADQFFLHVIPYSVTCSALFVSVEEES